MAVTKTEKIHVQNKFIHFFKMYTYLQIKQINTDSLSNSKLFVEGVLYFSIWEYDTGLNLMQVRELSMCIPGGSVSDR